MPMDHEGRQNPSADDFSAYEGPDIAILAMVGRFPGAGDVDAFWSNLREARCDIKPLSDCELDALQVSPEDREHPRFVAASAPLAGIEDFDAEFFGYSPREAELLDPQQRIFLECAWEALEEAGYDPQAIPGFAGVFAGATTSHYLLLNLASRPELARGGGQLQLFVANTGDSLATRVSYKLNLRGPSFSVQSACSTSLLAVHQACQSLLSDECDIALAGGVSVNLAQRGGYQCDEGSILAPNGVCAPFDASAQGTVFGSGVGVVVLKRLSRALADGDPIRAVIRGSAVNNDGRAKAGFTAPSVEGQASVIAEALAVSDVSAEDIGYVEAHGTGTALGDPIEIHALTRAFGATTQRKQFCPIGSLKGAIGHLDVASGVAGLIKAALCVENGVIPPSPGFETPNPEIDFANSPVYVNQRLQAWRNEGKPRRAGVSSFGIGGTNVHAVLEEAPSVSRPRRAQKDELLVVSARTKPALEAAVARLGTHLAAHPEADLASVAYTLQAGRHPFRHRFAFVARDIAHASQVLAGEDRQTPVVRQEAEPDRACEIAFLFPGQGSQYLKMGAELYRTQPTFRDELDRCARILQPTLGRDIRELIFAAGAPGSQAALDLMETSNAQPALFAVEYALAKTWMALGIHPKAMLGHSLGEVVAACLAGVFDLRDALSLVAARGRLMGAMPRGAMLSVAMPEADCETLLVPGVSIAAVNEAGRCVLAGTFEGIEALSARLQREGIAFRQLETSHAFHSAMMEPALEAFREFVRRVPLKRPELPFISNVTGTWIRPEEAVDPEYWVRHLRQPVRFADGLAVLRATPSRLVLEVGPRQTLTAIARRSGIRVAIASMPAPDADATEQSTFLHALGELWAAGGRPSWDLLHGPARPTRVKLPTYPFERRRYWIERRVPPSSVREALGEASAVAEAQALHPRPELEQALIAPRTDAERTIAEVWQEVLGISDIGVEDDFYDCGGDSLLATQIATRLQTSFGERFTLRRVLELRTIAKLAALVSGEDGEERSADPLRETARLRAEREREGSLPLSFVQERLWFLDQLDPQSSTYNMPAALRLRGELDVEATEQTLNAIIRRHESLRTTFQSQDGQPVQVVSPELALSVTTLEASEEDVASLAREEAARPFDLASGPLLRAKLLKLSEAEHVLLFTMHHIISDGWSMGILVKEVAALYEAYSKGTPSPLSDLTVQYADYALWQRGWLTDGSLDPHLSYWKRQLSGSPALLDVPTDYPRPAKQSYGGMTQSLPLGDDLRTAIDALCRKRGTSHFMALLAALEMLLARWSGQRDLVIGTVVSGRDQLAIEPLIGCFMNFVPLRNTLQAGVSALHVLESLKESTLTDFEHQACPFDKIVEAVQPERTLAHNPIYNVGFLYQPFDHAPAFGDALQAEVLLVSQAVAQLDLRFVARETTQGLTLDCEYRSDLFEAETIRHLLQAFQTVLQELVKTPEADWETLGTLPEPLMARAALARQRDQKATLALTATFTCEPIEKALGFWMNKLEIPADVRFAPYAQVFQTLLDPTSLFARNRDGANIILLRLEDWRGEADALERSVSEFIASVRQFDTRGPVPMVILLCPASPRLSEEAAGTVRRLEAEIVAALDGLPGVSVVGSGELMATYPVPHFDDPHGEELGHVPYTPQLFTALGTMVARRFYRLRTPAHKVIAVDCDQTLWKGVVGEDGPDGIELTEGHRFLQEFLVERQEAGMLICLVSKNVEADVLSALAARADFPLKREHVVTHRINWESKAKNLQALASELNLGLDSFIFLDDNPLEIAEVKAACPSVLAMQVPPDPAKLPAFLKGAWVFDRVAASAEDAHRTELYRQNAERERARSEAPSLEAFLDNLELVVRFAPLSAENLERAAQLTQRTNQFNLTTRRRHEAELARMLAEGCLEGRVVHVSDRFGDYGLVGLALYQADQTTLSIDTFLLSCRALGRGVEHRMLADLGRLAQEKGLPALDLHFLPTAKNMPAEAFVREVGRSNFTASDEGGLHVRLPSGEAANIRYRPHLLQSVTS